jgi:predicted glycoside hydrolase/deacetylase ChbG (UPF0249 family)
LKQLIVNADDFGFTKDVNAGIVEAHTRGILTATTLMANGTAFGDAVRLAKEHPALDVGCHLVLVGGRSLVDGRELPGSIAELLVVLARRRMDPYAELRAQAAKILESGLRPQHLDTHKHTHLLPPVLEAVARVGEEFGIRWVRRPMDFPLAAGAAPLGKRVVSRCFGALRGRFHRVLARHGCRTTDYFAGFQMTGRYDAAELAALIRALPEGSTEFMCHPGFCTGELRAARTRLKESRVAELAALTAREVREAVEESRVRLVRYGDVACADRTSLLR